MSTSAFSPKEEKIEVQSVFEKREQEIIFLLTKELIKVHFSDDEQQFPHFQFLINYCSKTWYDMKKLY
jgi:type III restriction enzyme